jgi:UDP-N-acetylmuramate--alanine ligase
MRYESRRRCNMRRVHFVAIGGQGMSGIATILLTKGIQVTGSDLKPSDVTRRLSDMGARVFIGHDSANILDPDLVVVSSAISQDNPEVVEARKRGIPILHRMDMLLKAIEGKQVVGIAGAHGKTTTSAMIAWILKQAGKDPTYLIGGDLGNNGNAHSGNGRFAVVETDESDGSFLKCHPEISIVTNIDNDHLDYWGSFEALKKAFYSYLSGTRQGGTQIVCNDDPLLREWGANNLDAVSYGVHRDAVWQAREIEARGWGTKSQVYREGRYVAQLDLEMPGVYNVQNALGAVAASVHAGVEPETACEKLATFPGVKRRMERIGQFGKVLLLDDFAHHPKEIAAVLSTIKQTLPGSKVIALFQPHRYSRTKLLHAEFGGAFSRADAIVVTGIYGGPGEKQDPGVDPGIISKAIKEAGHPCVFELDDMEEAAGVAAGLCKGEAVLITLGAGDIWKAHNILSELLAT